MNDKVITLENETRRLIGFLTAVSAQSSPVQDAKKAEMDTALGSHTEKAQKQLALVKRTQDE